MQRNNCRLLAGESRRDSTFSILLAFSNRIDYVSIFESCKLLALDVRPRLKLFKLLQGSREELPILKGQLILITSGIGTTNLETFTRNWSSSSR